MLAGAMTVWFLLTAVSLLLVVWDSIINAPTSWVQRAAWVLVVAYTGVVGLILYLLACRRPFPGGHDAFTRATWKQGVNSEMHCLAGDATGIVIAASIVPAFGLANGWDVTIEYLAGFVSGLFIFQALMMVGMYGGNYLKAVRKTFFAETVSMNFVMAGMIPTMVVLTAAWPESESPADPAFWFRMSLATIVGGLCAYPVNYWLVKNHLKHGCMTLPGRDRPAPCLGHCSRECPSGDTATAPARHEADEHAGHDMTAAPESSDHAMHKMAAKSIPAGHEMHDMTMDSMTDRHAAHASGRAEMPAGHEGHGMTMRELPTTTAAAYVALTFALLAIAIVVTSRYVPIHF